MPQMPNQSRGIRKHSGQVSERLGCTFAFSYLLRTFAIIAAYSLGTINILERLVAHCVSLQNANLSLIIFETLADLISGVASKAPCVGATRCPVVQAPCKWRPVMCSRRAGVELLPVVQPQ